MLISHIIMQWDFGVKRVYLKKKSLRFFYSFLIVAILVQRQQIML